MDTSLYFLLMTGVIGGMAGALSTYFYFSQREKSYATKIIQWARKEAEELLERAESTAQTRNKEIDEARNDLKERKNAIFQQEQRLNEKEKRIDTKYEDLEKQRISLLKKENTVQTLKNELENKQIEIAQKLESIALLSKEDARKELFERIEALYEKDILGLLEKKKKEYKTREESLAREILITAIQQYAGDVTSETTQTLVTLESDDLKGKIIWREGRNIIAFEKATGVSLIIDDSPDTVFLSSFDLFRRYIAKKSLEDLIADKRIQPARIEEIVEKNQESAEKLIYDLWRKTVDEMGIIGVPDELLPLIGKFRFRTSYGQNLLMHSKEVAYIAEAIAKLVGADPVLALKWGLLHDIGKAMDHDIEGTHPEIGGRIGRKYGLDEKLINIIEGHHDDVPQICIETKIVQIADAISAVRPWARRMNVEDYIRRIQEMENVAMSFPGVNKAYALSAGREVRVFVDALTVSDLEAEKRAQEIAAQIEANCSYPWEVKINLIREKRIVEYAK